MVAVPSWLPLTQLAILATAIASVLLVWWFDRARGFGETRRKRLLLGIPWGTLVSILLVLGVYLFVQDGWGHWFAPVVIPYRSWSYLYPLGIATSAFTHNGVAHLTGNLIGTVVLGSLAEFAWGHYPTDRGRQTFSSLRANPYVRAFLVVPSVVVVVGLLTSLFSWGPVIGFSGVVFAFAGFAFVRYPLLTVVALSADDVVDVVYRALQDPVVVARAEPSFGQPWWAGIAVQGHLLGLFLGLLIGAYALRNRDEPSAARRWVGAVIVAGSLSLWAIWWFRGNAQYVLYRGLGVVFIFVLAGLITASLRVIHTDRTFYDVPWRAIGTLALVFPILVIGFVAVPLNLGTGSQDDIAGDRPTIEVRDYSITYAENVTNRQTSIVNFSIFGETTAIRSSGVIVRSEPRQIWTPAVSKSRLAFAGRARVHVGGLGWRESITVTRQGWSLVGNGTAYRVWLREPSGNWKQAYRSQPVFAEPTLAGKKVGVHPRQLGFYLELRENNSTVAIMPMPRHNTSVSGAGITVSRNRSRLIASFNRTELTIAKRESYR